MKTKEMNWAIFLVVTSKVLESQGTIWALDTKRQKKTEHASFVAESFKSSFENTAIDSKLEKFVVEGDRIPHNYLL
jgi:hypothetical protein